MRKGIKTQQLKLHQVYLRGWLLLRGVSGQLGVMCQTLDAVISEMELSDRNEIRVLLFSENKLFSCKIFILTFYC